jgi:hypothetical protein
LILHESRSHLRRTNTEGNDEIAQPMIHITHFKSVGAIYVVILLLVIAITNITMRGLWTVLLIVSILAVTAIMTVARAWEPLFNFISQGRGIYINMAGYVLISTALLILWLANFFFMDRQTYLIFTPGQVRMRLEIGGAETVFDTTGMVVQRERGDLFRHWVLGFGSGDLIIKPVGMLHPLVFSNVLNVSKIVTGIERMLKEKVIMAAPSGPLT